VDNSIRPLLWLNVAMQLKKYNKMILRAINILSFIEIKKNSCISFYEDEKYFILQ
jgi:hypothetical protein